ncbi:MAG TPA: phosphoribosylpyrophosphate synthetase [Cytophagales bacterium]|nr:phosphoribosylpyrophosphate synthetase [Cytophagales bacterium]HAA18355.1 phosphoribosylpyrophosphate synthetase [Cytophagales bacterium]HAP60339.1 phosphoribosylpyrophosphate synthetase [Cytophagales bacterium]
MHAYDTLVEALADLRRRGYTHNFNRMDHCLAASQIDCILEPSEFEIRELYRFEGDSNPDDNLIVYAIASYRGHKGVLVNGYGPSAESPWTDWVATLDYHPS